MNFGTDSESRITYFWLFAKRASVSSPPLTPTENKP
jgi:hypothetical protein